MQWNPKLYVIVKDKVAEHHILGKYSNCNFGVTKALGNSKNFKVAITQLYNGHQV